MLDKYIQSEQSVADKEAYKGQAEVLKTRLKAMEQEIKGIHYQQNYKLS